jgi:hypothetical protein
MRIPSAEQLMSHCLTSNYRRCDVYRRFLTVLSERPERWRTTPAEFGADAQRQRRAKGD